MNFCTSIKQPLHLMLQTADFAHFLPGIHRTQILSAIQNGYGKWSKNVALYCGLYLYF